MAHSPIESNKPMTFYEALKKITSGKKATRIIWRQGEYGHLFKGILSLHLQAEKGYKDHNWIVSLADIEAEDWIITERI